MTFKRPDERWPHLPTDRTALAEGAARALWDLAVLVGDQLEPDEIVPELAAVLDACSKRDLRELIEEATRRTHELNSTPAAMQGGPAPGPPQPAAAELPWDPPRLHPLVPRADEEERGSETAQEAPEDPPPAPGLLDRLRARLGPEEPSDGAVVTHALDAPDIDLRGVEE